MPIRNHKIQLILNNKEKTLLTKTCGCNRLAYNWMLNKANENYENGIKFNCRELRRSFIEYKGTLPFMKEVNAHAVQDSAMDKLDDSFKRFFKKQNKYPKFKSKKDGIGSFHLTGSDVKYENCKVHIPRIGWLRLTERIRFEYSKIKRITIKERAGRWFCTFCVEGDKVKRNCRCENQASKVGIDLGIKTLLTLSDGTVYQNPKNFKKYEKRLRLLNKELSRREKFGKNWYKTKDKLRKTYYRLSCINEDMLQKITTEISNNYWTVCLEDLNVSGMLKNGKLSKNVQNSSFYKIKTLLEDKCNEVLYVDRFFPSSKMCSECGHIKEHLKLSEREYICEECGCVMDRDLNASRNIEKFAVGYTGNKKTTVKKALVSSNKNQRTCLMGSNLTSNLKKC